MNSINEVIYNFLTQPDGLNMNETLAQIGLTVSAVIMWVIIGVIAVRVLNYLVLKALRVKKYGARALTLSKLLKSMNKYIVWFIVALMVLGELRVDITPFIASAGVIGLAVGFGAQTLVKDFLSGFFIIFEGEFNVGEVIEIDGFKGKVLSLGLRTTVVENWVGEQKIVNNGNIDSLINYSRNNSMAIIDFGVAYDTDLIKLKSLMVDFVVETEAKYDDIVATPEFLGVKELANSSINVRLIAKTVTLKHFQVERDVRRDVVELLRKHDIEIPFPQVVVHNA